MGSITEFGYGAGGERLWKTAGSQVTQVWIGSHYEEKDGKVLFHVLAAGRRVCTFEAAAAGSTGYNPALHEFYYYHSDHLGSSSIITERNGTEAQHYEYSAYGRDRYTSSSTAFPISRRFTGQILDADTGLYYYNARYYDPELGRFIQPDTIIPDLGNPQSYNRYAYCLNNPLKYVDPDGHWPEWATPRNWIPQSWADWMYPNYSGPTYMTPSGQALQRAPSTEPAMNWMAVQREDIGGYDNSGLQAVHDTTKAAVNLFPPKAIVDSTYTTVTGKDADNPSVKVQRGDVIQAGGATASAALPTLGVVRGGGMALKAGLNMERMGLKGIDLAGKSYNSGRKALEKAGFALDEIRDGRWILRNEKTGATVMYDSGKYLTSKQKPHWTIQDKSGKYFDRSGRELSGPNPPMGGKHIPAD